MNPWNNPLHVRSWCVGACWRAINRDVTLLCSKTSPEIVRSCQRSHNSSGISSLLPVGLSWFHCMRRHHRNRHRSICLCVRPAHISGPVRTSLPPPDSMDSGTDPAPSETPEAHLFHTCRPRIRRYATPEASSCNAAARHLSTAHAPLCQTGRDVLIRMRSCATQILFVGRPLSLPEDPLFGSGVRA